MKTNKLLIVPDIHGDKFWEVIKLENLDDYDKVIFLGDYLDSFNIGDTEMIDNLNAVIHFKKINSGKVVLLWGNHDLSYLKPHVLKCPGYRASICDKLKKILLENVDLFQLIYKHDSYLFSHAGVTKSWIDDVNLSQVLVGGRKDISDIDELNGIIDDIFLTSTLNMSKEYLSDTSSSPIWIRPHDFTDENILNNYHQIVGHTPMKKTPVTYDFEKVNAKLSILDNGGKYCHILDLLTGDISELIPNKKFHASHFIKEINYSVYDITITAKTKEEVDDIIKNNTGEDLFKHKAVSIDGSDTIDSITMPIDYINSNQATSIVLDDKNNFIAANSKDYSNMLTKFNI